MSHDTLLHRAVRPAAHLLALTVVRPNHLTILRLGLAAAAAFAFASAGRRGVWLGAWLFVCAALLDRMDGELARRTGRFSVIGHRLDLVGDCGSDALAFLAMGIGARHGALGPWAAALGVSAALGTVSLFWQMNRPGAGEPAVPGRRPFDPDDAMLLVPVLACWWGLAPVVVLAGVLAPLSAAWLLVARSGPGVAPPVRRGPALRPGSDRIAASALRPSACLAPAGDPRAPGQ